MDQRAVGAFIAALRRERGWTQAELGERLQVTNKTVSRWETGRYLPDIAALTPLCEALGIGVNELLSGRRLPDADFRRAADDNVLIALREQKTLLRWKRIGDRCNGAGVGMLVSLLFSPDSPRKLLVAAAGIAAVLVSWALRARMDRRIFQAGDGGSASPGD